MSKTSSKSKQAPLEKATTDPEKAEQVSDARSERRRAMAEAWTLPGLLIAVVLFFSFWPETSAVFPTSQNIKSIVANQSVIGILALAALIPLICGQFDLSIGAILGVSSIFAASVLEGGASIPIAVAVGVSLGGVVGLINGLLVTRAAVNSVIATLGTAVILHGIVVWKTGGTSIVDIPAAMTDFGSGEWLGVPRAFFVLVLVAVFVWYLLEQTPFGRYLHALGSNWSAAELVGLSADRLVLRTFVVSGLLAGLAGLVQLARVGSASPEVGENFTLPALAAAFLSAAAIRPGRFNAGGVVIAIFFVATLNSGLTLAGAEAWVSDVVNGAALIVGVALSGLFRRDRAVSAHP